MKCPGCSQENKDTAAACKKCGRSLAVAPAWFPDWKWHARTLGVIYLGVVLAYFAVSFALRRLPAPYQLREIPPEMTPWLKR